MKIKHNTKTIYAVRYLLYLLILMPFITEYIEHRNPNSEIAEWITEIIISIFITIIVSVVMKQNKKLEILSLTDHLTGISNRRQFEIDIKREITRARRLNIRLALIFFDLDGFKMINDKYGHKAGDMVLIKFSECLSLFIRKGVDFCYRFGGDEFAVLLTSISKNEDEVNIESRIEQSFAEVISDKLPHKVSVSKGIVVLLENESYSEFLARADQAMYDEKIKRKRK